MRKGDAVNAFNTALHLWEAQRLLLDLPTPAQLGYLLALQDAARHKVGGLGRAGPGRQGEIGGACRVGVSMRSLREAEVVG